MPLRPEEMPGSWAISVGISAPAIWAAWVGIWDIPRSVSDPSEDSGTIEGMGSFVAAEPEARVSARAVGICP